MQSGQQGVTQSFKAEKEGFGFKLFTTDPSGKKMYMYIDSSVYGTISNFTAWEAKFAVEGTAVSRNVFSFVPAGDDWFFITLLGDEDFNIRSTAGSGHVEGWDMVVRMSTSAPMPTFAKWKFGYDAQTIRELVTSGQREFHIKSVTNTVLDFSYGNGRAVFHSAHGGWNQKVCGQSTLSLFCSRGQTRPDLHPCCGVRPKGGWCLHIWVYQRAKHAPAGLCSAEVCPGTIAERKSIATPNIFLAGPNNVSQSVVACPSSSSFGHHIYEVAHKSL
ncbi:hypothetical protein V8E36_007755 [Tilletia maclaganii]